MIFVSCNTSILSALVLFISAVIIVKYLHKIKDIHTFKDTVYSIERHVKAIIQFSMVSFHENSSLQTPYCA
jgi:hypothetical protein